MDQLLQALRATEARYVDDLAAPTPAPAVPAAALEVDDVVDLLAELRRLRRLRAA